LPGDVQNRVLEGSAVTVEDIESNRTFGKESVINVILPIFASFIFMFATMTAAGYMLQVVANEKENRTIEIMVTSVTTKQFIFGKAAGLLGATLSQLGIYALAAVVGLKIAASYTTVLTAIEIPWGYLVVMALFFFPAYTLLSAIMIAIGSMVTELQQGQQAAGILNLMFLLPVIVLPLLFQDPGHPGVLAMTLFPTTSFLTISLRWGMGTVPSWQIGLSWVFLVATTLSVIWLAARIFRAGMLHYGQPLKLKAIWVALRAS
jgi:ABC-2 type transport system permease protein